MAHIQHLVEDHDITLMGIKDVVDAAARGDLPDATEKLDGVNIMFSSTSKYAARFARSESDIRTGGMSRAVLEAKFTGRGLVQEAFAKGANAIATAVRTLTTTEVLRAFEGNRLWYSAEIIYTKNPNVVQYASDCVVFHNRPVLRLYGDRIVPGQLDRFDVIEKAVPFMDEDVRPLGWRVHGPQRVTLKPLEDPSTLHAIHDTLESMGSSSLTLREYLRELGRMELSRLGVKGKTLDDAVERLVGAPGCPSLTTIRSKLPSKALATLRESDKWVASRLQPLDHAISRFASAVLRDLSSALVEDNAAEARRIDERLARSVKLVADSRIPEAIEVLNKHLPKVEPITTPVEGVVFPWGDKIYKLTGAFAPANAIMGLCKYGRGKAVPPLA